MRPASLRALLAWYRAEVYDVIPLRIHSRDTGDDGAPDWHGRFRTWITMFPAQEDRDGQLISPLRFWLWRLGGARGRFLKVLAYCDFDWRSSAIMLDVHHPDAAHDFTQESLRRLHLLMLDDDGVPNEPRRAVRGYCLEPGCETRTDRLRCDEHLLPAAMVGAAE